MITATGIKKLSRLNFKRHLSRQTTALYAHVLTKFKVVSHFLKISKANPTLDAKNTAD